MLCFFALFFLVLWSTAVASGPWIDYPSFGYATMTHYTMPKNFIASCGCTSTSSKYPTAALSQMAYGSNNSYGPACGRCFQLTLLNTFLSNPPFHPSQNKSLVVKITDLCPLSQDGWCSGTVSKNNSGGHQLNFDLVYPSSAIPKNFFPSNVTLYGYADFGVWNISYEIVPCNPDWAGRKNHAALGSVARLGTGACCPADPPTNGNGTCPSFSEKNGIPPNTATGLSHRLSPSWYLAFASIAMGVLYHLL